MAPTRRAERRAAARSPPRSAGHTRWRCSHPGLARLTRIECECREVDAGRFLRRKIDVIVVVGGRRTQHQVALTKRRIALGSNEMSPQIVHALDALRARDQSHQHGNVDLFTKWCATP